MGVERVARGAAVDGVNYEGISYGGFISRGFVVERPWVGQR
jgi:hypothetical protein